MRGNIESRSKGTYRLRYDGPPDANGRRKQISETIRGTKKAAEGVLRNRLEAIENWGYVPKHKETVAEYMDRWLSTYAATNTSKRTQHGYRAYVNRYIVPNIGAIPLQRLSQDDVDALYAGLLARGLSGTTVAQLHRILRQALSHAVKRRDLAQNVAASATSPRVVHKEMPMWDVETINKFIEVSRRSRFGVFYHLAILTGLRRSELIGLQWEHVDLVARKLSVVKTLQHLPDQGFFESQPKTKRSRRSIALSPVAVELFHAVRGQQIEQRLASNGAWTERGYVFTEPTGMPVKPDQVTQEFARIVVRERFPHLTLHGLRHAHATIMLASGIPLKVISERLGHASILITADIYSHLLPGMDEEAVLAMDLHLANGRASAPA